MTLSSQRCDNARLLHSADVSSFDTARYPSSTSRIWATNSAPVTIIDTSKSRLNDRMSMFDDPITAVWSSTEKCFACSTAGYGYWKIRTPASNRNR